MKLTDLEKYKLAKKLIISTDPLFSDFDSSVLSGIDKAIKELRGLK